MDLALNDSGDIFLSAGGDLSLVTDGGAVIQHIRQRLRFFRGEWFLDTSRGVPYFAAILGKKTPDSYRLSGIFRDAILGTPGVISLTSFSLDIDKRTRVLSVSFSATTPGGEIDYEGEV